MSATTSRLSQDGVDDETVTLLLSKEDDEEAASATPAVPTTHCSADEAEDERPPVESASARAAAAAPAGCWPHTFERSMALLASPILPTADAAYYSKSPAPGAAGLELSRRRGSDLDRGIHSPGPTSTTYGSNLERNVTTGSRSERNLDCALVRTPSLNNFQKNHFAIHDVQQEQQKRQTEAKMYRQQLLQKNKKKQKIRKSDVDDGNGEDHKASVLQCIFNLSNILMGVGLLGLPYVYRLTGYVGGTACILVLATICWRTAILIGRCLSSSGKNDDMAQLTGPPPKQLTSFPDIARASFGETGCYVLSTILYFEVRFFLLNGRVVVAVSLSLSLTYTRSRTNSSCFIQFSIHRHHYPPTCDHYYHAGPCFKLFSCISIFFVSMGDHLHTLIPAVSAATHMTIVSVVSMIPTILLRTPALLSYLSMVGTVATIAVVLTVVSAGYWQAIQLTMLTRRQWSSREELLLQLRMQYYRRRLRRRIRITVTGMPTACPWRLAWLLFVSAATPLCPTFTRACESRTGSNTWSR
jgi:Transmembrane amino acid transporter protein